MQFFTLLRSNTGTIRRMSTKAKNAKILSRKRTYRSKEEIAGPYMWPQIWPTAGNERQSNARTINGIKERKTKQKQRGNIAACQDEYRPQVIQVTPDVVSFFFVNLVSAGNENLKSSRFMNIPAPKRRDAKTWKLHLEHIFFQSISKPVPNRLTIVWSYTLI